MEFTDDPTGFIKNCVSQLIDVGFDAASIDTAKIIGTGLFIAILAAAFLTFSARLILSNDKPPMLSEAQFRALLIAAVVLITLPMITKLVSDKSEVGFVSSDRAFAHRVCTDSLDLTAGDAKVAALASRVEQLESFVQASSNNTNPTGTESVEIRLGGETLAGQAATVFYRSDQATSAAKIVDILRDAGLGVAQKSTDLSESPIAPSAKSGELHIVFGPDAEKAIPQLETLLSEQGIEITRSQGPFKLRGSPIQILLF